jgi:5'(3')-deoxyribonucleotidase
VLGVDLDGVVADFYGFMRGIVAEWKGHLLDDLSEEVSYGLPEWDVLSGEYPDIHRFAVTQRNLFREVPPIDGGPQALRNIAREGDVRIRIITHRLFIPRFHKVAVDQTVTWLDHHGIPYSDLCFMEDKQLVDADTYIEDNPKNILSLQECEKDVVAFSNSTNRTVDARRRADTWPQAEDLIKASLHEWRACQA